jgi:hypothetical protein
MGDRIMISPNSARRALNFGRHEIRDPEFAQARDPLCVGKRQFPIGELLDEPIGFLPHRDI